MFCCRRRADEKKDELHDVPVIFVAGLLGSHLERPCDGRMQQIFLKGIHAVGLDTPDLSLPKRWEVREGVPQQERDDVRACGGIENVKLFGLPIQTVYSKLLESLRASRKHVHVFTYDWRRSLQETNALFDDFLAGAHQQHGGRALQLIAYSLGGLVSLPTFKKKPGLFHSALFIGCGFSPTPTALIECVHLGWKIGLNSRLLAAPVAFTMPVFYNFGADLSSAEDLRALEEYGDMLNGEYDENKKKLDGCNRQGQPHYPLLGQSGSDYIQFDPFNAEDWVRMHLSVFGKGDEPSAEDIKHLSNCVSLARSYRQMVNAPLDAAAESALPPVGVLRTTSLSTAIAFKQTEEAGVFEPIERNLGDGVALCNGVFPPHVRVNCVAESGKAHLQLTHDVDRIFPLLLELHRLRGT